ncbi:restriction endonuclease subunit S [Bacillus thuringiensis]|nr:restriction endonuclease subunit S [Bacillus thuringiensis]MED2812252.1 restriction endonuclease subunit S [Bacillus thuringiensis]MED2826725.1 restriction endonuclease subunit S [Bacillus thuringiensis]MED2835568.1 restriction endonuclease subunit S [Bacillus thuringiensis]MED2855909.1 restriction endonuclease subunit S [Bacillus thuringiensis]
MKNKYTPEIRFKGFTGDWEQRKLGGISEKVTEKNKNNIYSETLTNSAEFGIIKQRDFFDKDISNEKNLGGYYVVRPDDFVYNPRISNLAPVGPIKRNKLGITGVMSPLYYVFSTYDVDKTYLEKYFSSNSWHIFMKLNGDSGARSDRFAIKDSLFCDMPIPIPSIEEQIKIGNFFEQLDDTIALHQQELTTLKQTKKGFLQKMFPKEGESVPEVRFSGFAGKWKQRKLGDFINTMHGGASIAPEDYQEEGVPTVPKSAVNSSGIADLSGSKFVSEDFHQKNIKASVYSGDLITSLRDLVPTAPNMGRVVKLIGDSKDYLMPQGVYRLLLEEDVDENFMIAFSNSDKFRKIISQEKNGSTQVHIRNSEFLGIKLKAPESEEQIQIGNFFKQLDDTIILQQRKLDALKETKKAFLQKMFA